MSKYSSEFKLEVVKYCIEEHHGRRDAAKKFGIPIMIGLLGVIFLLFFGISSSKTI